MEANPARHLHVVDADTGEKLDGCPNCEVLQVQLDGRLRDIRSWTARYNDLSRDKEADAKKDPLWPEAGELFNFWKRMTGHKKSEWSLDRFELVEPFLKKDGQLLCRIAVVGAAYDPFITRRKNGSLNRHDGFDLIFRNREKFEEMANRAPVGIYKEASWYEAKEKGGWE